VRVSRVDTSRRVARGIAGHAEVAVQWDGQRLSRDAGGMLLADPPRRLGPGGHGRAGALQPTATVAREQYSAAEQSSPSCLATQSRFPAVHGMLACAILAAQVGCVVR
jgi:hypothetical protein